jgi:hypothetical protein
VTFLGVVVAPALGLVGELAARGDFTCAGTGKAQGINGNGVAGGACGMSGASGGASVERGAAGWLGARVGGAAGECAVLAAAAVSVHAVFEKAAFAVTTCSLLVATLAWLAIIHSLRRRSPDVPPF